MKIAHCAPDKLHRPPAIGNCAFSMGWRDVSIIQYFKQGTRACVRVSSSPDTPTELLNLLNYLNFIRRFKGLPLRGRHELSLKPLNYSVPAWPVAVSSGHAPHSPLGFGRQPRPWPDMAFAPTARTLRRS